MSRMTVLLISLALVACGGVAPAGAQKRPSPMQASPNFTAAYKACMASGDAARGVTVGILNCTQDEIGRQDQLLNDTYRQTLRSLDQEVRGWLQDAERKWIKARDALCDSEAADSGEGSYVAVAHADCFLRMTAERVTTLNRIRASGGY